MKLSKQFYYQKPQRDNRKGWECPAMDLQRLTDEG